MRTTVRPLLGKRRWTVRRRPKSLSPFWRKISVSTGVGGYLRQRDWLLVLNACHIPHIIVSMGGREYIYVPPLLECKALRELAEFSSEAADAPSSSPPLQTHDHGLLAVLFLLPLVLWHGWRMDWWGPPEFLPPAEAWSAVGALDNVRTRIFGQWYRVCTALTLHASLTHLWSNMAFGAVFLPLLARLTGVGRALWLTVLGGMLGNATTVLLRPRAVTSIGFSTALFAAIGAAAGYMASRQTQRRKAMLPVAAGAALLAMLGTEGENTDYLAHVAGLCCGMALGAYEYRRLEKNWPAPGQWAAAVLALALPVMAWYWAFAVWRG